MTILSLLGKTPLQGLCRHDLLVLIHKVANLPPPKDHFLRKKTRVRLERLGVILNHGETYSYYHSKTDLCDYLTQLDRIDPTLFDFSEEPQEPQGAYCDDDLFKDLFLLANEAFEGRSRHHIEETMWVILDKIDRAKGGA